MHDYLYEALLPAFTHEEAQELLARCIYFKQHPEKSRDADPDEKDVKKTKEDYASTIDFLIGALGYRARALAACFEHNAPLPDVDLAAKGVALPGVCDVWVWAVSCAWCTLSRVVVASLWFCPAAAIHFPPPLPC